MDINNKYLLLPSSARESYFANADRIRLLGTVKLKDMEKVFPEEISAANLSAAKAIHLALQCPSRPLSTLAGALNIYVPLHG